MKSLRLNQAKTFKVLAQTPRSQAAEMIIQPGKSEGGPSNRHPRSDQWVIVTAGKGIVIVEGKRRPIHSGSVIIIEKGERHEIKCTGNTPLKSLNIYAPAAY